MAAAGTPCCDFNLDGRCTQCDVDMFNDDFGLSL
jgi:hypothetical protein